MLSRMVLIQEISIDVMLQDKFTRVKPIVKDLTAHNMSTYPPAVLIALVP